MNRIKIRYGLLLVIILCVSCSKEEYNLSSSINPFVRFNFLVNNVNKPLEYPAVSTSVVPLSTFENKAAKILKIPVTLTSGVLKDKVVVDFSTTISGDSNTITIQPTNKVVFEGNKLTDTIFLSLSKRLEVNQTVKLKLEKVSDPSIQIGNLNTAAPNNIFTINLSQPVTTYSLSTNMITLKGEAGEKVEFKLNFPNGAIPSEVEDIKPFSFVNGFDYVLTREKYDVKDNFILYRLTLLKSIQNDDVRYQTKITLNGTSNYSLNGTSSLIITKPVKSLRDVTTNPAANFYDLSNSFNQTFGINWFERSGTCVWQTFNVLTFPVVVTKDDPNAVLQTTQGTQGANVYHDAFKIGFNVASGTNTVNSFNLRRWFTNANISAANSPGFNITSALEFFPKDGTSKTNGAVLVIPQDIIISGTNGNRYVIAIEGEGTYNEISKGLFEIVFDLKLTNEKLFGGTVIGKYKIYNKNTIPVQQPLNIGCRKAIDL